MLNKIKSKLLIISSSVLGVVGSLLALNSAHAQAYLIQASDTIPIFESGATALKTNGLAILNVSVPWLAGALVAVSIVYIFYRVFRYFRG